MTASTLNTRPLTISEIYHKKPVQLFIPPPAKETSAEGAPAYRSSLPMQYSAPVEPLPPLDLDKRQFHGPSLSQETKNFMSKYGPYIVVAVIIFGIVAYDIWVTNKEKDKMKK